MRAGHFNFSYSSLSALVWGWTLSKILFEKFNNYVSNNHCRWSDEFQISALRKCVTLAAIKNGLHMLKRLIDYLVNDLGVQPNTAATIILTLFTFLLGFIITWTAAAISKWAKRKKYKKSFKIIISDFLSACKIQYQELEKFPLQKGYLNGSDYIIAIKPNYGLKYLSNLDINVFIENFSSIFKKSRAAEISQLLEIVEQVKSDKESIKETIDFTYLKYSENFDIYNENLDSVRKLYENLPLKYNGTQVEVNFHNYIQSIIETFNQWNMNGAITHINVTLNEIVNPLYIEAKKVSQNEISRDIIEHTLKCRLAVDNIQNIERLMKGRISESLTVHKNAHTNGTIIIAQW